MNALDTRALLPPNTAIIPLDVLNGKYAISTTGELYKFRPAHQSRKQDNAWIPRKTRMINNTPTVRFIVDGEAIVATLASVIMLTHGQARPSTKHNVYFTDGDSSEIDISNLSWLTRKEYASSELGKARYTEWRGADVG